MSSDAFSHKPHPRRTLNRLAWAGASLLIAGIGQYFLRQDSLWDGCLFIFVAAILFAATFAPQFKFNQKIAPFASNPPPKLAAWQRNVGVWLVVGSVGLSIVAYTLFGEIDGQRQAWWFYVAGIFVFVVGGLFLTANQSTKFDVQHLFQRRYIFVLFLIILGLALVFRLYRFDNQPFGIWFDEAQAGLQARQMLQNPEYRPILYSPINITGHLLGLYAAALSVFGDNILSMRLVSVSFGVGAVVMAFLFGREVHGPRFGLVLAFLIAVTRWHINFSRIAMTGIDTTFFEFLSLYFLARWLKQRRVHDAIGAGLSLGFGLMFYTAFRLYILALVLFTLIAFLVWGRWIWQRIKDKSWRTYLGQLLLLLVGGWLVVMPLVQFAFDNPEQFWYRTQQISIFTKRDQADILLALQETTQKHLLMFNVAGDKNGRHNLPGEPMLDPMMGILWLLGFGLTLGQLVIGKPRHPAHLFFPILFFAALIGGIFSVDFEAPQSLRSIAIIPAIIYFVGVAITAIGREMERVLSPLSHYWLTVPTVIVATFMAYSNATTYFIDQHNDFASWNAFSTPETVVGQQMAELGPDHAYLISPFFTDHPSIRFLAPDATNRRPLELPNALPIRTTPSQTVTLFIHPDDEIVFEQARNLYPNADFNTITSDSIDKRTVVHMVNISPTDVASLQGLDLTYVLKDSTIPLPVQAIRVPNINATWPQDSPLPTDFLAEWTGILYVPKYETHNLRLVAPSVAKLEIDDFVVMEGEGEQTATLRLPAGNHKIHLLAEGGDGEIGLYWQPIGGNEMLIPQQSFYGHPITNNGLKGTFYSNDNWEGSPVLERIDPELNTYFHLIPLNRPYSVEWSGWVDAPQGGNYILGLRAVHEAQLFINGEFVLTTSSPNQLTEASLILEAGLHDILIRFKDTTDRSRIHLTWTRPDGQFEPIPTENLWPPLGRPPESIAESQPQIEIQSLILQHLRSFGGFGVEPGQFNQPRDIAVQSNGNIIIADTANRRVQMLDALGNFIQMLPDEDLPYEEPLAVVTNSQDEIFVLESTLQWVYRYDVAGNLLGRFAGPEARLFHPRGMALLNDTTIAVSDTGGGRTVLFNPDGSIQGQIGIRGEAPGQFIEPTDIIKDDQENYFIVEAEINRLQYVDAQGRPLNQWNIPPAYGLDGPHLAAGPDNSIFMTSFQTRSLIRYAPNGNLLDQWQIIGPVSLVAPIGIYFDDTTNHLYVSDVQTHQVHVFEVLIEGQQ